VPAAGVDPEDVHLQDGMPREAPETGADGYAWRGRGREGPEAAARLVRDLGVPRTSVAFLGYWRLGASEGS
jgi:NADPH-dependent ferric siderophore reductase